MVGPILSAHLEPKGIFLKGQLNVVRKKGMNKNIRKVLACVMGLSCGSGLVFAEDSKPQNFDYTVYSNKKSNVSMVLSGATLATLLFVFHSKSKVLDDNFKKLKDKTEQLEQILKEAQNTIEEEKKDKTRLLNASKEILKLNADMIKRNEDLIKNALKKKDTKVTYFENRMDLIEKNVKNAINQLNGVSEQIHQALNEIQEKIEEENKRVSILKPVPDGMYI